MRVHIEDIAWVIRERRETLKITQQQLADLSGVGIRTIQKIEGSKGNPTIDVLDKLLTTLGLTIEMHIR